MLFRSANSFRRSKQFTHVLMSDNDIGTPAWTVLRMLERQVDFAVAAPPLRRLRLDMALEAFKAGAPKPERFAYEYAMELLPEDKARGKVSVDDRGFMRVERAGSAFMLLSRAVFEKIADAHPELCYEADDGFRECMFFQRRIVEGKPRGEDVSFCMHWRALGGSIWLLIDAHMTHQGPYTFEGNYMGITGLGGDVR